jgi:hypothetical protein
VDKDLLAVAARLLDQEGWAAPRLERIADAVGVSRGHGLAARADPPLRRATAAPAACRRLPGPDVGTADHARHPGPTSSPPRCALCAVAERNLPLLAHTDTAFHGPDLDAAGLAIDYFAPWLRILEQGRADGSLAPVAEPRRFAVLVTDTVLFSYVHLRARHRDYRWTPRRPATP